MKTRPDRRASMLKTVGITWFCFTVCMHTSIDIRGRRFAAAVGVAAAQGGSDAAARGRALLRVGKLKEAEAAFKQSAQERGQSLESLYDLARVNFAAGDYA